MSDIVLDSSVIAKWLLPEPDSAQAQQLISRSVNGGHRLIILDLAFPEVANAIWKRQRRGLITLPEAKNLLAALQRGPVNIQPAIPLLFNAFEIAIKYDRAVYDALFIALANDRHLQGVTADEPLYNAVHKDFPNITLLRNC